MIYIQTRAASLIDVLESFNRKERHILWEQATGSGERLTLSAEFRSKLSLATGLSVPWDALALMDFHLNWLYAALLTQSGKIGAGDDVHQIAALQKGRTDQERQPYEHNQEDIDLLVAFEAEDTTFVLLVEAKGFTSWSNTQIASKLDRLDLIVDDAQPGREVELRLVLSSFAKWQKLAVDWGRWKGPGSDEPAHVVLTKPADRRIVEECADNGLKKQGGGFIHLA